LKLLAPPGFSAPFRKGEKKKKVSQPSRYPGEKIPLVGNGVPKKKLKRKKKGFLKKERVKKCLNQRRKN